MQSTSQQTLEYLKSQTGHDFEALREKYSKYSARHLATASNAGDRSDDAVSKAASLDKYAICKTCNGLGIVKEIYNHYSIDKNCPECDGESLKLKSFVDNIVLP